MNRQKSLSHSNVRYASRIFILHSLSVPSNVHTYIWQIFIRLMKYILCSHTVISLYMYSSYHFILELTVQRSKSLELQNITFSGLQQLLLFALGLMETIKLYN